MVAKVFSELIIVYIDLLFHGTAPRSPKSSSLLTLCAGTKRKITCTIYLYFTLCDRMAS